MAYGLTPTGFNQKRQDVILAELHQALKDEFGEIGTDADQVFGMLAGVFSNPVADIWELLAGVYSAMYRTAEGVSLDYVAEFVSLFRVAARPSSVDVAFGGDIGSVVPIETQVQIMNGGAILATTQQVTLSATACVRARTTIAEAFDDTEYAITINGIEVRVESPETGATAEAIAELFKDAISDALDGAVQVTRDEATLQITVSNLQTTMSVSVGSYIEIDIVFCQTPAAALETGPIIIPTGSVTEIVTPVTGVSEVINLVEGTQGRNQETDAALRTRIVAVPNGPGKATETAIKAAVTAAVSGVSAVQVISNRTDEEDDEGRPPHSVEVIVQSLGGDNDVIAQAIYDSGPAGIQFVSSLETPSTGTAIDANGEEIIITFSRPAPKLVWLWVDIETFDEEQFPDNGLESIAAALLAQGNESQVGIDIIVQKFYRPIYSVPGIANATIYMTVTDTPNPPKPDDPATNYAIAGAEIAVYADSRIVVSRVD